MKTKFVNLLFAHENNISLGVRAVFARMQKNQGKHKSD